MPDASNEVTPVKELTDEEIVNEVIKAPKLPEEQLEKMFRLQETLSNQKQRILMACHNSGMDSQQQLRFLNELYRILDWS